MITRLTSPAFSICAEVHVPALLNVYRHRADLIQEFGRRNATFWASWKVPARGTGWNGQKRAVRERNRRTHPPAASVFRKRLYIPHQAAARNWGEAPSTWHLHIDRTRNAFSDARRNAYFSS